MLCMLPCGVTWHNANGCGFMKLQALFSKSCGALLCFCTGSMSWAHALAQEGPSDGLTALAEAAALSVRSTHPVSQALLSCANSAGSALPQLQLHDFHQKPGTLHMCRHSHKHTSTPHAWSESELNAYTQAVCCELAVLVAVCQAPLWLI